MLLIKNQRIFHTIVTHLANCVSTLSSFLFLINRKSSLIGDFFISTIPSPFQHLQSLWSHYEKPRS